jgi:hypothetical protein
VFQEDIEDATEAKGGFDDVRGELTNRLFEGPALDRNNLRCQGKLSPVRGGNDGGSMAGIS